MNDFLRTLEAVAGLIVGVALVSIIVSKNANTTGVIQAAASGFGNSLAVAEAPVTNASTPIKLSYPSSGLNQWSQSPML
jgi:hypothetical protein